LSIEEISDSLAPSKTGVFIVTPDFKFPSNSIFSDLFNEDISSENCFSQ
jgi:hypothetical protein